jgi:hypothetical protein
MGTGVISRTLYSPSNLLEAMLYHEIIGPGSFLHLDRGLTVVNSL